MYFKKYFLFCKSITTNIIYPEKISSITIPPPVFLLHNTQKFKLFFRIYFILQ